MTGKPDVEFLTDDQWLKLLHLVPDNIAVRIFWPKAEGESLILWRKAIEYVIKPDGSCSVS